MRLWSTTTCPSWDRGQQRPAPQGIVVSKDLPIMGSWSIKTCHHRIVVNKTTCPSWDRGQQRPAPQGIVQRPAHHGIVVNKDLLFMRLWSTTTCPSWDRGQQRPAPHGIVVNNDLPLRGLWIVVNKTTCPHGIVVNSLQ
ncbi:hypothetical protein niasHT_031624 [Heterodera trifolii]|uniref:Uncharacterized protein n=1 Tax=Heterodera trifolii TaxID=157864 RepID=A0ABD2IXV0_9BILA